MNAHVVTKPSTRLRARLLLPALLLLLGFDRMPAPPTQERPAPVILCVD